MFVAVWRFVAKPGRLAEFEQAYGPDGDWAQLFRQGIGYEGTTVLCSETKDSYLLADHWLSRADFENFKKHFRAEYETLDKRCDELTVEETHLGYFEPLESTEK